MRIGLGVGIGHKRGGGGDKIAPTFSSAEIGAVDATTVAVTFSEAVTASNYATGVTIKVNTVAASISSATRQSNQAIVRYVIGTTVYSGDTVTWEYASGSGNIADLASNALGNVSAQAVTNTCAAFNPASIAGLLLWFKADYETYQNSNKTTPATADGDPVGYLFDNATWHDGGSTDLSAKQATAGQRPILKTGANGINGRAVLRGTRAANTELVTAYCTPGIVTGDFWFMAVVRPTTMAGSGQGIVAVEPFGYPAMARSYSSPSHASLYWYGGSGGSFASNMNNDTVYLVEAGRESGVLKSVLNGAADATTYSAADRVCGSVTYGRLIVCSYGASADWNTSLDGDIGEVLFYANKPSASDLTALRAYLNGRWAVY